ncbi:MAG: hypothetical protein JEZ08_24785 [Clostridiales bacterium]|nr:hypothetical protein [Clostridiales bacterium]
MRKKKIIISIVILLLLMTQISFGADQDIPWVRSITRVQNYNLKLNSISG